MDKELLKKINLKISETLSKKDEIKQIVQSLEELGVDKKSFIHGIVVGRLYNSFYYQSKRILNREPTNEEFSEFLNLLKDRESALLENF